ncbi:hypothetical protein VULLAG_LOCUS20596 [Vulpes lagopus]|uniref:ribosomal large subunit pseudouridine synthase B-like isoform X1 n=1 Tax=Vulpes lagopus TaxID=494514 RepID=UPI001BC99B77|nr:ribosomal large subunit pseudouridine synthase B-like isoform X1 [Vulpes lagopus]
MTHSPQRSGTFILAPALRTAPGKGRVEPREPARGSPQSPQAEGGARGRGGGRVRFCAGAVASAGGRGRKEEEGEGRAALEPANGNGPGRQRAGTRTRGEGGPGGPGGKAEVERGQNGREETHVTPNSEEEDVCRGRLLSNLFGIYDLPFPAQPIKHNL